MQGSIPPTYLTQSQAVQLIPCTLHSIIVSPNGSNASYADVHDGDNSTEPLRARIRCSADRSTQVTFPTPLQLHRGLFIAFGANLHSVSVQVST